MRIGYACQVVSPDDYTIKGCVKKNAHEARLRELIAHNLQTLDRMITYNIENGICLFRISSDIIPFGSSPVNKLDWAGEFRETLSRIGQKIKDSGMRVSMHPGQYTVLNSPNAETVDNAVLDLVYHAAFLDSLGVDGKNKLILHIGGVYGDKALAVERFCQSYMKLPDNVKARLIIENDDKMYTAGDVLAIAERLSMPMVFDNLHHQINSCGDSTAHWIARCRSTWREKDGPQKIHYSQQAEGKKPGSHSHSVHLQTFLDFVEALPTPDIDIMLEVKDKNLSAVKCCNCTNPEGNVGKLEQEWARYKYTVLEHNPAIYQQIRSLLKDKSAYPAVAFYQLLEDALDTPPTTGTLQNAAQHVWGYFKKTATEKEQAKALQSLDAVDAGNAKSIAEIKRYLRKLSEKYHQEYLLQSYYSIL